MAVFMEAVLESGDCRGFAWWPVAEEVPPYRFLRLSGRMTPPEVGTALASMASCVLDPDGDEQATGAELLRRLAGTDHLVTQGGLLVRDGGTGVTVAPGCCCGLEEWRDWLTLAHGDEPWLGHDPSPRVEHAGPVIRLWPDGRDAPGPPGGHPLELRVAELLPLLQGVQEDLRGFLALVEEWAGRHAPGLGPHLRAGLDEGLGVSTPLGG